MATRTAYGIGALRRVSIARPFSQRVAPFSTTAPRLALKETSPDTDATADDIEKHKHDSLSKQKRGTPHWKPELATQSEEDVKADRGALGKDDIAELQRRTAAAAKEAVRSGTDDEGPKA